MPLATPPVAVRQPVSPAFCHSLRVYTPSRSVSELAFAEKPRRRGEGAIGSRTRLDMNGNTICRRVQWCAEIQNRGSGGRVGVRILHSSQAACNQGLFGCTLASLRCSISSSFDRLAGTCPISESGTRGFPALNSSSRFDKSCGTCPLSPTWSEGPVAPPRACHFGLAAVDKATAEMSSAETTAGGEGLAN